MSVSGDPVPEDAWVCRFIRRDQWSATEQRPEPTAFSASRRKLSVFGLDAIRAAGYEASALCFGSLKGAGEAHLLAADYADFAPLVSAEHFTRPVVVWRPDEVGPDWERWRDAHANASGGNPAFPLVYRVVLAQRCTVARFPEEI